MTRNDVPLGKGQCDIRLQVDGEAEVSVEGDRVLIRTISGRDARDDGSECNEPLPYGEVRNFAYEVRDSRGEIALLDQPSRRSGRVVVRIRDSQGGEGRYHFRLTWDMAGSGNLRPGFVGGPPAATRFGVNEAISACDDAVRAKIFNDFRFPRVDIRNSRADDRPGRNDYILGEAYGQRGGTKAAFTFFCRVDFSSGRVRSVDVTPRR